MRKLLPFVLVTLTACSSTNFSIERTPEEHAETSIDTDRKLDSASEGSSTDSDRELDTATNADAVSGSSETLSDARDTSPAADTRTTYAFPALVAGLSPTLACVGDTSVTTVARALPVRRIELLIKWWYKYTCTTEHRATIFINGTRLTTARILPALGSETKSHLIDFDELNIIPVDGKVTVDIRLDDAVDRACVSIGSCGSSDGGFIRIADGSYLVLE